MPIVCGWFKRILRGTLLVELHFKGDAMEHEQHVFGTCICMCVCVCVCVCLFVIFVCMLFYVLFRHICLSSLAGLGVNMSFTWEMFMFMIYYRVACTHLCRKCIIAIMTFWLKHSSLSAFGTKFWGVGYQQDSHTMRGECVGESSAEAFLHEPYLIANSCDTPNVNRSM